MTNSPSNLNKIKLGTRRSLLAWAQSSWVAREIEKVNPGLSVELVGIDTQGDKILDKPLSQIDGKEFFTAELDHALLKGEVHLTVHSMKDLALDRPAQFKLAATPKRELQHDIIVFHETVIDRLKAGLPIRIGTSSPRRLTLIPEFLLKGLPQFSPKKPVLEFVQIRGNVNTRLGRIHEVENTERKLDGVVLAIAGLERLALDEKASLELWKLLEQTRLMILPLRDCPSAPAQGALAIEVLATQTDVLSYIKPLHDEETLQGVKEERVILQEWGGGCHQKLGASFVGHTLYIRGQKMNGVNVNEIRGARAHDLTGFVRVEAKDLFNFQPCSLSDQEITALKNSNQVFFAHARAYENTEPLNLDFSKKRVWVSGTPSWFKLAAKGLWIEGGLEGQGFESLTRFLPKKLLRFNGTAWAFLTHKESVVTPGKVPFSQMATYQHELKAIPAQLLQSEKLYWTSSLPFLTIWSTFNEPHQRELFKKKTHACGPGKTAAVLREHGIEPLIFTE